MDPSKAGKMGLCEYSMHGALAFVGIGVCAPVSACVKDTTRYYIVSHMTVS